MPGRAIFFERYGVTVQDIETYLGVALDRGGDYADLFFELRFNHSIFQEEHIVKTATKAVNLGVGVRVLSGEKTGYAYSENLDRESILKAARTAAFIASSARAGGNDRLHALRAQRERRHTSDPIEFSIAGDVYSVAD